MLKVLVYGSILLPGIAVSEESCNGVLQLGLYNVTHAASATDAQSLAISNFCSYDYSKSSITASQKAQIEGSYGIASGGASGSASSSEIIEKQKELCVYGFNSSKYSSSASSDSKIINNATLQAWNRCQELKTQGVIFDVQPYSSLQGVGVTITAPSGLSGTFSGVTQIGFGHSKCNTSSQGKLITVSESTPFRFTGKNKVTISCKRQFKRVDDEFVADQQDLEFVTSAGNFFFTLEATGNLSRMTVDRLEQKLKTSIEAPLNKKIRAVSSRANQIRTELDSTLSALETDLAGAKQSIAALDSSAVRFDTDYYVRFSGGAWDLNLAGYQMFEGGDVVIAGRHPFHKWRIER